jgi:hypothetical protein
MWRLSLNEHHAGLVPSSVPPPVCAVTPLRWAERCLTHLLIVESLTAIAALVLAAVVGVIAPIPTLTTTDPTPAPAISDLDHDGDGAISTAPLVDNRGPSTNLPSWHY